MSEEVMNEVQEELVETVIEETVEQEEGAEEVIEQETKPVEKPWQKNKVPEHIPYQRFKEVNEEKRQAQEKLAEYEKKLAEFESSQNKTKSIENIDELVNLLTTEQIDTDTYTRELVKIVQKEVRKEAEVEKEKERIGKIKSDIINTFNDKVAKASEKYPDIKDAVDHVAQYEKYIPAEVQFALLTDDNSADIMYEIASDEELLKFILTAHPIDVQRKLGRLSAKYDKQPVKESMPEPTSFRPKVAASPKTVNAAPAGRVRKYSDSEIASMSGSQYRAAKEKGLI